MKRQAYQHPELRDANNNIIQQGAFGKNTALANSTNDGWIDYVANDLEALYDNINGSRIYVANKAALPATGDLSAMYIAEDTGKWYLWDGTKYIETDNARKIADEAIAARDAAKASANDAANSAREQQADWNVTDTTSMAFIKNKPAVYPRANLLDPQLGLSNRVTTMNTSYGDSTLRYFNATSAIVDGTKEIPDAHILHMAWDNGKACDAQLAITTGSKNIFGSMYFRTQDNNWSTVGWRPWKEVACKDDTIAKAKADAAGNNIQETYAKKSDLSSSVSTTSLTVSGETSVPTANAGNSSKAIANTEFVAKSLASLVNGAPAQLNTLNELAKALGNDANFSATITAELAKKLNSTEAESTYLPLRGGTLTGVVNGVTPTAGDNSTKIATTEFVNAKAGNYLPLSGGTMTRNTLITMGNGESYVRNWGNGLYLGGTNSDNASRLVLFTNSNANGFQLEAGDGTTFKRLHGYPDGTLIWDGQPLLPVGVVQAFAGRTMPQGWLLCDGSAVSRTDYAALFAVIGTTYGAGNGSTTFNLPNLTDKFIQGSATAGTVKSAGLPNITGNTDGAVTGQGFANNKGYKSLFVSQTGVNGAWQQASSTDRNNNRSIGFDASRSSSIYGNSNTVQPPALTMRYIIKY